MATDVGILLWTRCPARRAHWQQMLAGTQPTIWDDLKQVPNLDQLDVVIVDRSSHGPTAEQLKSLEGRRVKGELGVIQFGAEACSTAGPADLLLPDDTNPRELQLACRLLGDLVHLRRAYHRGQQTQVALHHLTLTDHLTGAANRRAWDAAWEKWPEGLLVLLDLDHFKTVNDRLGHPSGDRILQQTAARLRGNVRSQDLVARIGGDEFGLLLAHPPADPFPVVDRIRHSVRCTFDQGHHLTASAGYVRVRPGDSRPALLAAADAALGQAKLAGRNRTVAADSPTE